MPNQDLLNKTQNITNILTDKAIDLLLNTIALNDLTKFSYIPRLDFSTRPNSAIIAFDYAIVSYNRLYDLPSSELFFVLNVQTNRFLMATRASEPEYINQLKADYVENKLIMHNVDRSLMPLRDLMLYVKIHENEDTLYSNSLESYLYKYAVQHFKQYLTKIGNDNKWAKNI